MQSVAGRVAVITGGAAGIGAATAKRLVDAGCLVLSADRNHADEVIDGAHVTVAADITDMAGCRRIADRAVETFGRIDAVVGCAGIDETSRMSDGDPDHWRVVIETNLTGMTFIVRACLPAIIAGGGGDVILMSSIAGRRPTPMQPVYSASKWGLVGLGQAMRTEVAKDNVRVTVLEPGMVDTALARNSTRGQQLMRTVRPLDPSDVAEAVLFALAQPRNVCVAELVLMPTHQP